MQHVMLQSRRAAKEGKTQELAEFLTKTDSRKRLAAARAEQRVLRSIATGADGDGAEEAGADGEEEEDAAVYLGRLQAAADPSAAVAAEIEATAAHVAALKRELGL